MCCSPLQTTSTAQHRQRGDYALLGLVTLPSRWNATIFWLANRCAIITFFSIFRLFRLFDFSIFRFWIPRQAMHHHQLIPLIPGPLSSLTKTYLIHQSVFSQGISYIVVATSLLPGFGPSEKGSLARAWNLGALHGSL